MNLRPNFGTWDIILKPGSSGIMDNATYNSDPCNKLKIRLYIIQFQDSSAKAKSVQFWYLFYIQNKSNFVIPIYH